MDYNNLLGTIIYENKEFSNIFKRFIIEDSINPQFLENYYIKDGQTLEDISYEKYGNEKFWQLIAILNNIRDVFYDIPVSEEIIQKYAKENSYIDGELDFSLYLENYEKLSEENDKKRQIKLIKKQYISDVVLSIMRDDSLKI